MSVGALVFGNDCPRAVRPRSKCCDQLGKCFRLERWPVDQRNHGAVATAIQHLLQSNLERAELPSLGGGVHDQIGAARVNDGTKIVGIRAGDDENKVARIGERADGRRKQSASGRRVIHRVSLWPGEQGFVPSHPRGLPRRENYAAKTRSRHACRCTFLLGQRKPLPQRTLSYTGEKHRGDISHARENSSRTI